jgi:hypothetical protein
VLQGCLVHQGADGQVGQQQAIDLTGPPRADAGCGVGVGGPTGAP